MVTVELLPVIEILAVPLYSEFKGTYALENVTVLEDISRLVGITVPPVSVPSSIKLDTFSTASVLVVVLKVILELYCRFPLESEIITPLPCKF